MPPTGVLLCVASAAAFGAMGIFGKLAYEEGVDVGTLLAVRFLLAASVLWVVVFATGRADALRRLPRADLAKAFALGAVGYSAQAASYFVALERLDASLLSLLLYTFPSMVAVAAIVLGRERARWQTGVALVCASIGLVLVLTGAAPGALDPLGTFFGIAAAVVYSTYILSSAGVAARIGPLALSTMVCTGAAFTLTIGGAVAGGLHPGAVSAAGYGWLAAIALISTVAAIGLFFAGLPLVGPTAASILSTVEPVVTVSLAFAVFDESLGPSQLAGGLLVLAAVFVIQTGTTKTPDPRELMYEG